MASQILKFDRKWTKLATLHSKFSRQQIKLEDN